MFGISGEHLVVLVVILLIFGPKRLPQLGNTLGKAIKNFKDAVSGVEDAKFRKIDDTSERAEFRADELNKGTPQSSVPQSTSPKSESVSTATPATATSVASSAGSSGNGDGTSGTGHGA